MDLNKLEEDSNGIVVQPNGGFVTTYNSFIRNPNISSNAKILYLYLLGYSGRGQAFPSVARIEREIGWRRQKITSVTKELEAIGGIYYVNRICRRTKRKSTNLYYLADIDNKTGTFNKDFLDTVKEAYPEKVKYIWLQKYYSINLKGRKAPIFLLL